MRSFTLVGLVALGLSAAAPAAATTAVPASVEELARGADAVVRGRVVALTARRSSDGRRISTYVQVEPLSVWRGQAGARLTVVVPGGEVGGLGQLVVGAPRFAPGEEVVVFVTRAGPVFHEVPALAQGKFTVAGGQARPDLSGLRLVPRSALVAGERAAEPMAVDELERRVRAAR